MINRVNSKYIKISQEQPQEYIIKLILFFIWPFGAWAYSLMSANKKSSYLIFFLFSLLICWHFAPTGFNSDYDDFIGILDRFNSTFFTGQEIYQQIVNYFHFSDEAPKELYENIVIWLIKSFTDNYHYYFLICSIPVAYCQLKSLYKITSDSRFIAGTIYSIIILLLFINPRDIITVQNPRFATGLWICILCTIYYFSDEKKNILKILPIIITPLIHSGMWPFLIVTLIFILIPKNIRFIEILFICTIPFLFFTTEVFRTIDLSKFLPGFLYKWTTYHNTDEAYAALEGVGRAGFWWVGASFNLAKRVIYAYMGIIFIRNNKLLLNNPETKNFYPFYLFFYSFVNIIQSIPVLGERYYIFIRILTILIWFKAFGFSKNKIIYALLIACSWDLVKRYGYIMGGALSITTSPDLFFTPLPYLIFKGIL